MTQTPEQEALFTTTPPHRAVLALAVPTVISQLITVIYNMADTFFIGRQGDPNQVAAATLAMPLFMLLTAFANLFGIGGASLIARSLGVGARDRARRCAAFCIWAALSVSLGYGLLVLLLRNTLLPLLGTDAATQRFCADYVFWTITIGAVPTVLSAALAHLIRAEGFARQASFGIAFGGLLNIALDPLFIFVFRLQITGAAIATMLSNVAALAYFLLFLHRHRQQLTITADPRCITLRGGLAGEVLAVGLPSFLMTLMSTFSNLALNQSIAAYSNEAVAGIGIAKKIDLLAFAIAQGLTQGTLPLISYTCTARNLPRMRAALKFLLLYTLGIALLGMIVLYVAAGSITRCFIQDTATVSYGRTFLRILCLACPTTALNFLVITVFQATGAKLQPLILSLLRKGSLDIPLMYLLNAHFGLQGIAWATPLADTLALLTAACLFLPYLKTLFAANRTP